jgi:hypothetical protein
MKALGKTDFAKSKRIVLRGRVKDVIKEIAASALDFIYIDGDHTLRGITLDLMLLFDKVKDSGFIGGDDFNCNPWQHGTGFEPTLVCPFAVYFAEAMNVPIRALPHGQFLIHKQPSGFKFVDPANRYANLSLSTSFEIPDRFLLKKLRRRLACIFGRGVRLQK